VRKFIQSVLGLIDEGRDITFSDVARLQEYTLSELSSALRVDKEHLMQEAMPDKDWEEIVDYINNYTTAHGSEGLQFYDNNVNTISCAGWPVWESSYWRICGISGITYRQWRYRCVSLPIFVLWKLHVSRSHQRVSSASNAENGCLLGDHTSR